MQNNLTSGSVFKNILSFSLPYLLSYFLQTLYGMADLFLIGRYGEVDGTTAVSIGSQVMHMLTVMIVGLAMGATVMIGQAVGAQNRAKVNRYIGNTITLFAGTAAVLTLAMLSLSKGIVRLMSTPEAAQAGTEAYLRICFAGLPFIIAYNVISAIFRGMGDSKSPMYFIAAACAASLHPSSVRASHSGFPAAAIRGRPKVLVLMASAPASRYAPCTARTPSGSSRFACSHS